MNEMPDYLKNELNTLKKRLSEAEELYEKETDAELGKLAKEEIKELKQQVRKLQVRKVQPDTGSSQVSTRDMEHRLKLASSDGKAGGNAILEIRAGAGGNEAGLFAAVLYRMYQKYAEKKGWKVKEISRSEGGLGNIKEVIAEVLMAPIKARPFPVGRAPESPYQTLKLESGVHRVQRVPVTESGGRIHTSTASVAILSQVSDVEVDINPKDLRVDTFRSSGKGGQNVNKLETAVRITHMPSGTVVECQEERNQQQNRNRAMAVLRARLYDAKLRMQQKQRSEERRQQVGTMDRSEKIRTYNFPQNRVTDHRIKKSWGNLKDIIDGGLDPVIKSLRAKNF